TASTRRRGHRCTGPKRRSPCLLCLAVSPCAARDKAYASQSAHILRGCLISSRVRADDSPGTIRFRKENHGRNFPSFSKPDLRLVDSQVLQEVKGPQATPSALTSVVRHHCDRALCGNCRRSGWAGRRNLWTQSARLVEACP